ncbi:MAG: hypothetical protein V1804_00755 [Patescibacteria group bacterium]
MKKAKIITGIILVSFFPLVALAQGWNPGGLVQFGLPGARIGDIIRAILTWLLSAVGIIAIIAFAISGIQYMISAGNTEMIENAKKHMTWSIVGVIVALSGLVVIFAIDTALRGYGYF